MEGYHPSPYLTQINLNPQDKESIKAAGQDLKTSIGCSKCRQLESDTVKLMKCAKCKFVLYCSKQCQKEDWPAHKSQCGSTADQKVHIITDLVNYFLANKFLHCYLELALILELGLKPEATQDHLFTAQFYVYTEPCDISDFKRIWSPRFRFDPTKEVKMKGMFQLLGLTTSSAHPHDVPSVRQGYDNTSNFSADRREADKAGHSAETLVQCEFVGMTDGAVPTHICNLTVSSNAFMLAEELDTITVSNGINKPLTVATCLEFINMHIRQDTENQLHLRSKMTVNDVRMINYTRNRPATTQPFIETFKKTLRGKVDRESIYAK